MNIPDKWTILSQNGTLYTHMYKNNLLNEPRIPDNWATFDVLAHTLKALCHYITSQIPKNNHRKSWWSSG